MDFRLHPEKRFNWMKENNLFERLFLIQIKDLFVLNNLDLILLNFNLKIFIFVINKYLF